jgi:hypothetical protein
MGCDEWFELAIMMRDGCPLQSLVTTIGHPHLNQSDPLLEAFKKSLPITLQIQKYLGEKINAKPHFL